MRMLYRWLPNDHLSRSQKACPKVSEDDEVRYWEDELKAGGFMNMNDCSFQAFYHQIGREGIPEYHNLGTNQVREVLPGRDL